MLCPAGDDTHPSSQESDTRCKNRYLAPASIVSILLSTAHDHPGGPFQATIATAWLPPLPDTPAPLRSRAPSPLASSQGPLRRSRCSRPVRPFQIVHLPGVVLPTCGLTPMYAPRRAAPAARKT